MVFLVPCKDVSEYQSRLSRLITKHVLHERQITFIDCCNSIHQYLFDRDTLPIVGERLYVTRIERLYDFLDQLERIACDPHFRESDMLLVSSYTHLLEDVSERQRPFILHRIGSMLTRLEQRHHITVILMDINFSWDTLYLPNAKLYMAN